MRRAFGPSSLDQTVDPFDQATGNLAVERQEGRPSTAWSGGSRRTRGMRVGLVLEGCWDDARSSVRCHSLGSRLGQTNRLPPQRRNGCPASVSPHRSRWSSLTSTQHQLPQASVSHVASGSSSAWLRSRAVLTPVKNTSRRSWWAFGLRTRSCALSREHGTVIGMALTKHDLHLVVGVEAAS